MNRDRNVTPAIVVRKLPAWCEKEKAPVGVTSAF